MVVWEKASVFYLGYKCHSYFWQKKFRIIRNEKIWENNVVFIKEIIIIRSLQNKYKCWDNL